MMQALPNRLGRSGHSTRLSYLLVLALSVTACSGGSGSSGTQDGGGGTGSGQPFDSGQYDGLAGQGGSAGDSSVASSDACGAYIACTAETTPAGLDAVLAAYGEGGSCWAMGDPELCETACRSGLIATHSAFPNTESCNVCWTSTDCPPVQPACDISAGRCVECASDLDCGSSDRPACDSASATCVPCTSNVHCSGFTPVCDTSSHLCLRCLTNSDCPSDVPICDPASHQCFECASDNDCANSPDGHKCDVVFTHQCGCGLFGDCGEGRLCESGACCTPDCGTAVCGPSNTIGCGSTNQYACGVCPNNGTCYQGGCSDLGNTCTPGADACYAGEACLFNRESQEYTCLTDVIGAACNNEYSCNVAAHGSGSFVCPAGKCRPYCLSAADCPSGVCEPWGATVSPTSPGVCVVP